MAHNNFWAGFLLLPFITADITTLPSTRGVRVRKNSIYQIRVAGYSIQPSNEIAVIHKPGYISNSLWVFQYANYIEICNYNMEVKHLPISFKCCICAFTAEIVNTRTWPSIYHNFKNLFNFPELFGKYWAIDSTQPKTLLFAHPHHLPCKCVKAVSHDIVVDVVRSPHFHMYSCALL